MVDISNNTLQCIYEYMCCNSSLNLIFYTRISNSKTNFCLCYTVLNI
uniref:Uncharacterized protein n=1 Tax=Ciona intestinalis TaxID=7719 RepID=H2Y2C5_CIOIN